MPVRDEKPWIPHTTPINRKLTVLGRSAQPVACELCGWKGKRIIARSKPCPSCGNGKVQFR